MYLEVVPEAEQTQQFLNYLATYLTGKRPFEIDKIIDISILENSEKFPAISEIVKENSQRRIGHKIIAGIDRTMLFKFAGSGRSTTSEITDQVERKKSYRDIVVHYLRSLFVDSMSCQAVMVDINNPLGHLVSFKITDVAKLEEAIEKCNKLSQQEIYTLPTFQESPPKIIWGSNSIGLEVGELPFYICKIAFAKPAKTMISWEEVVEEMDGPLKDVSDITSEKVRDSVRHFNKRIKGVTGRDLLEWVNLSFY